MHNYETKPKLIDTNRHNMRKTQIVVLQPYRWAAVKNCRDVMYLSHVGINS